MLLRNARQFYRFLNGFILPRFHLTVDDVFGVLYIQSRERNETSKNLSFLLLEWKNCSGANFCQMPATPSLKERTKYSVGAGFPPLQVEKGYKSLPIVYSIHVIMVDYLHLLDLHGSYGLGRWLKSHHLVTVSEKWRCRTRMTRWKTRSIWMLQLLVWTLRR